MRCWAVLAGDRVAEQRDGSLSHHFLVAHTAAWSGQLLHTSAAAAALVDRHNILYKIEIIRIKSFNWFIISPFD